jgi:hypothetical protein
MQNTITTIRRTAVAATLALAVAGSGAAAAQAADTAPAIGAAPLPSLAGQQVTVKKATAKQTRAAAKRMKGRAKPAGVKKSAKRNRSGFSACVYYVDGSICGYYTGYVDAFGDSLMVWVSYNAYGQWTDWDYVWESNWIFFLYGF